MQSRGPPLTSQTPSAWTLPHRPLAAVYRLMGQRAGRTTCSAIVERLPQVAASLLICMRPCRPTSQRKHTLPAALRQNCRSPIIISSALSPRAKALARDASHPELVMSGIPWPNLEAGQSQPRAEFLGSSAVHTPSVCPFLAAPTSLSAVIFLRLRLAADMTCNQSSPAEAWLADSSHS
jgi:hypothetical protein